LQAQRTRIQLCGKLVVELEGEHVECQLPVGQGRLLFGFLALNRRRSVERDELVEALWPHRAPTGAEASLRVLVSRLRRVLGDDLLRGRANLQLTLPYEAWLDVEAADAAIHRAESAIARGKWHEAWAPSHIALNISRRAFLAGLEVPWVDQHRRHLEGVRLRALECWAAAGVGIGGAELVDAETAARKLIAEAPLREGTYMLLMRALDARGKPAEAVRIYDELRHRLDEELGITPGPGPRELHARILLRQREHTAAAS
jgi:DNA-binding SARP family transcriptional activator